MGTLVMAEDGTLDVGSVSTFSLEEIANWIKLRLHGGDHLVPSDVKQSEPSYHLFASIYPKLDRDSRDYVRSVVEQFLGEMSHGDPSWRGDAGHSLLLLAQELSEREFINPIRRMAEDSLFFDIATGRDIDEIHRRLLQSLVALQWRGSVQFWRDQFRRSASTYAAVAFAGLNRISINSAMEILPLVPWEDVEARRTMRVALRGLLPAYDHMLIGAELSRVLRFLPATVRQIVNNMLPEVRGLVSDQAERVMVANVSSVQPSPLGGIGSSQGTSSQLTGGCYVLPDETQPALQGTVDKEGYSMVDIANWLRNGSQRRSQPWGGLLRGA